MGAQAARLLDAGGPLGDVAPPGPWDGALRLDVPPGRLAVTALLHGGVGLPPFGWDGARLHLRLPAGRVRVADGGQVRWRGDRPDVGVLRRVLGLEDDLSGLWAACDALPELRWVRPLGAGRVLRSPTVWQDLLATLAGTRASYASTRAMLRSLPGPGPAQLLDADLARWGFRGRWLRALAGSVAGGWDPEGLQDASLDDAEVQRRVRALPGFGPFAAAQLAPLLGRPRPVVLDGWLRSALGGAGEQDVRERFAGMGRWAGTGAWLAAVGPRLRALDGGAPPPG